MKLYSKKSIQLLIFLLLIVSLFAGCTKGGTPPSAKGNELVMGLDDTFAPMGFRDAKGELVGFDVELAKEVSKRIGKEIKFQPIDWSMKETELNAGNIDLIWNGYSITDERKEKVAFTDSYLANSQIIVTLADSPVKTIADLKGLVVSAQAESSALDAAYAKEGFVESLKNGEIIQFSTNNEAFNDLEAKRSDAIVVDEVLARYYMSQNGEEKYEVLEENLGPEEFGVGLRKSDTKLLKEINKALADIKNDGTFKKIYDRWFSDN